MTTGTTTTTGTAPYRGFDGQYIAGSWRSGRAGAANIDTNPYSGETLAEVAMADVADLDDAYRAAERAQAAWAALLPAERAEVMLRSVAIMETRRDEIVDWLVREAGSTRDKAAMEWQLTHSITVEAATFPYRMQGRILPVDEPGKESRAYRQPLGVIGVISPWNFPLYLSHRSVGPALALGNAVVLKPAADTPITGGLLLAKIYEEAGLPPGVLNVVVGPSKEIGDPFVLHDIPSLISFTGSTPVGSRIGQLAMQGSRLKRVALELGGNAPFVVLDDADLDRAVPAAVVGRFLHQGQICISTNRFVVDARLHDEFVERFVSQVRQLRHGDPGDPAVAIGPIINTQQLQSHLSSIDGARQAGARQLVGGAPEGQVLPPHVFVGVDNAMDIAQHETFGPIAPIIAVDGDDEALRVANDTPYGLSSCVFAGDEERARRFALGVRAGMTHVNDHSVDDTPTGPFGGEKNSGIGRFGGDWIIDEFTRDHWVTVRHQPALYPPAFVGAGAGVR